MLVRSPAAQGRVSGRAGGQRGSKRHAMIGISSPGEVVVELRVLAYTSDPTIDRECVASQFFFFSV